ncbi:hypothetical protein SAMN03159496_00568 [Rhizobium sp. NFR07]|uniref:hypothetical protein n=1 Tax=Rhizobium sp. NFR07 TaxID=1566262 RepID=UPI0008EB280A|nr:hypothetical protein [Rhizobium sp. NFR07]SFA82127.1 hypothetical protein SAMN03159496_00568 [Rhizobium sp. NFR07]
MGKHPITWFPALIMSAALAGPVYPIEPIKGSLTYDQPNKVRLKKAPVGSRFRHEFFSGSDQYVESYIVNPDRTLKLTGRVKITRP